MELSELFNGASDVKTFYQNLKEPGRHLVTGVFGSLKTVLIAELFKKTQKPLLVCCDDLYHAQSLADDLTNLIAEEQVDLFPVEEEMAVELATSSPEFKAQRVKSLADLSSKKPCIVVSSVSGFKKILPPKTFFEHNLLAFEVGKTYVLAEIKLKLMQMGYTQTKLVERPGDFAIRGSIVDIYALNTENPVRLDFFDDELDSLRLFDAADQRSLENKQQQVVLPATELVASSELLEQGAKRLQEKLAQSLEDKNLTKEAQSQLKNSVGLVISDWKAGLKGEKSLLFAQELYADQAQSLSDYLAIDGMVIFDDYVRLKEQEKKLDLADLTWLTEKIAEHKIFAKDSLNFDLRTLEKQVEQNKIFFSLLKKGMGRLKLASIDDLRGRNAQQFFGQMPLLKTEALRWQKAQDTVVVLLNSKEHMAKVQQTFNDFKVSYVLAQTKEVFKAKLQLVLGNLQQGFELPNAHLLVLTEAELFENRKKRQPKRQTMANTERLKSYTDLKKGDYVVHVNHGIGRFMGMETLEVGGKHQDYMTILYRDDAKLFIPVSQLDRVQKYVSAEGKTPRVNKLGGSEWQKTKNRVAAKIEDIADELVELYAQRSLAKGHAFPKDDSLQREFEAAFPYTETQDQLRSAKEIKLDMEKKRPMDRLLIGDVGYGKTEVALRAAFKAVDDGKQVAFLAPTTVLVQQHYDTMLKRFENFPVEIGMLSRFNSPKQTKETLAKLKDGRLDIIVGTHRLLSKDVKFADLGLLIIDEEQRFGVKHKERLKELKASVDVLTLTATPIPRTLNMSMLGVRDLSVIETAPMNRYPIQTYVMEQNYTVIADGIKRELARKGQVFYLHNRVHDIEQVAETLSTLVPEAKIGFVHGQMTENQLEGILFDFIAGEYDVLVTTTIIETGVDMPNVNTLFVENADQMGLAQLYQLRGRVGRSNRVAYAYFMYQPDKVLTEVSEKRLEAIKDFTELGSGFKIAMRDLSIRGAGNLLGKQQHGFIDSVGYDLYTQMLSDAVAKKRGVKKQAKTNCEVNLQVEAYLPETYIEDSRQKIEIYKRIHQLHNEAEYEEIKSDLEDRFGAYPDEVANLLEIGLLKLYADYALLEKISQVNNKIEVLFSKEATTKQDISQVIEAFGDLKVTFGSQNQKTLVTIKLPSQVNYAALLYTVEQTVHQLARNLDNEPKKVEEKA